MKANFNAKESAIRKLNALLAIANDKGASQGEKDNALEMAKKLAEKYGLKVERTAVNTSADRKQAPKYENHYCWYPKYQYTEIIRTMADILKAAGIKCFCTNSGRKITGICYYSNSKISDDELSKLYKLICKHCDAFKKSYKDSTVYGYDSRYAMGLWQSNWYIRIKNGDVYNYSRHFDTAKADDIVTMAMKLRKEVA